MATLRPTGQPLSAPRAESSVINRILLEEVIDTIIAPKRDKSVETEENRKDKDERPNHKVKAIGRTL